MVLWEMAFILLGSAEAWDGKASLGTIVEVGVWPEEGKGRKGAFYLPDLNFIRDVTPVALLEQVNEKRPCPWLAK
jgi:hypothetical protein